MPDERVYSEDELMRRIWDIEDIRDLMSRRSFYCTGGQWSRELNELWVSAPEYVSAASFGGNWGFYCGMESIRRFYESSYRSASFCSRCVNTPLVILSDDGASARGRWYMSGQNTLCADGQVEQAWWSVWTLGADFVREGEQWKILHLVEAQDFYCPVGEDFDAQPVWPEAGANPEQALFASADYSLLAHDNTYMLEDDWPPVPQAYETLNMYNSYGPEGHPALNDRVHSIAWATEVAARKAWGR
ncbi:MAG: nuclear transport factor 2 family protein [Oscillospiraceae bacterium]|nr:nuclear transport factor 2 family protein [Oscillospiraceae bacterium]